MLNKIVVEIERIINTRIWEIVEKGYAQFDVDSMGKWKLVCKKYEDEYGVNVICNYGSIVRSVRVW